MQHPSHPPEASHDPQQQRLRNVAPRMPGFVTGDGLGLSSSPRSERSSRSDASVPDEATRARGKDEKATVAMAGQFMNDVLIFGTVGPEGGGAPVEYCPAGDRVVVIGRGWSYVTIDDGGLVRKMWDAGEWTGQNRLVGVECKGRGEQEYVMERGEVVGQHVAEMLGRIFVRMEDIRDDGPSKQIDRLAVLFCFCQNKFALKWVEPSEFTLHELFGEGVRRGVRLGDGRCDGGRRR